MRCNPVVRPGFHPLSIFLMIAGFILAWPLGLLMLAYMVWGDRMRAFAEGLREGFARRGFENGFAGASSAGFGFNTGNAAFDEYRAAEIARLEAERRRLDEERREFEAYLDHLRRARDREEFERFKADRAAWRQRSGDPTRN